MLRHAREPITGNIRQHTWQSDYGEESDVWWISVSLQSIISYESTAVYIRTAVNRSVGMQRNNITFAEYSPVYRISDVRFTFTFDFSTRYKLFIAFVSGMIRCWGKPVKRMHAQSIIKVAFSDRELTFTFATCCRPSVCLSVCRLSVCNARAPYSGGWNFRFRQYFYGIWYLGHPLTSTKNLRRSYQGNPSVGGVRYKHKTGSQIYRFWTHRRLYLENGAR